jgi:hypothetical protein
MRSGNNMKWRFWRKENSLSNLDPHVLAYVMVQKVVNREFPFNKWRDDEDVIPERPEAFIEICVNVYQMTIFLDLVELKFSSDVSGIIQSHIIAIMNKGDISKKMAPFYQAVQLGRANPDREQFFAHDPAIQVDCNVAKAFLAIAAETQEEKDAIYPLLGKSLTLGRVSAETAFQGVVGTIEFRPETIIGLRKPEDIPIAWSELCGCFERHLQRRHRNRLFPSERRRVSTANLIEAQVRDWADVRQLQTDMESLSADLDGRPAQLSFDHVLGLRDSVEKFIVRAAGLGAIANHNEPPSKRFTTPL